MEVILIGSGNVARLMGKLLTGNGHRIQQVYSRNPVHAKSLADSVNATAVGDLLLVNTHADLYIIAVADDALPGVAASLRLGDKLVIHTSGSVAMDILQNTSSTYGVLWPVKMIRSATEQLSPATIVIDGNSENTILEIANIAAGLSAAVTRADSNTRMKMHMIATFTANFSNHLYHLAADYCDRENIAFADFFPLIEAAVEQLREQHPRNTQAGAAFRGDRHTIEKHRKLLNNNPRMQELYDVFTESIRLTFDT